jgi:hypothetical protein
MYCAFIGAADVDLADERNCFFKEYLKWNLKIIVIEKCTD